MSMNIEIIAVRNITAIYKNGKSVIEEQQDRFNCIQTPTEVTYNIINVDDKKQAYIDYVKSLSNPQQQAVYADNDIFETGPIIRYNTYDWTIDHLEQFEEWVTDVENRGFTIEYEMI